MRFRSVFRVAAFMLVGLAGCTYTPVYNGALIETDLERLSQYWVGDKENVSFKATPEEIQVLRTTSGRTSGTFLIDSNGKVTEIHIAASEPPGVFDDATIKNFSARSYKPGPENADHRPAKVRFETNFSMVPY